MIQVAVAFTRVSVHLSITILIPRLGITTSLSKNFEVERF